jgi:hypothetical protein
MKSRIFVALVAAFAFLPVTAFAGPPLDAVRHALVGTWQNNEDTRFTREFAADGTAIDRYADDPRSAAKGTWTVFDGNAPPAEAKSYPMIPQATYLEIRQNGDVLIYGLANLTTQSLDMIYLERGNRLSFARLK